MQHNDQHDSIFGEVISVYSRAQAIADGTLIDITQAAREAGFRIPVAITAAAWADCVAWREEDSQRQVEQDEAGRLWDLVWMASLAARHTDAQRVAFVLYRVPRGGRDTQPQLAHLYMSVGPGDDAAPVLTILMRGED